MNRNSIETHYGCIHVGGAKKGPPAEQVYDYISGERQDSRAAIVIEENPAYDTALAQGI